MPKLTDPITLGAIQAPNRIFMSPLTRGRSTEGHVPTPIMADYYRQRASAGLIISEGTGISRQGLGWAYAPGLWTREQVEGWRPVVAAVHEAGGRIVAQLWHMGRQVHPDFLGGDKPVAASANTAPGHIRTYIGKKAFEEARPLEVSEIPGLLDDYARAAEHALEAGFDGVQLHAANGYLLDSFLRNNANARTDDYGGSVAHRIRLLGEVADRLVSTIGGEYVGVRVSPNGAVAGVNDSDPHPLFEAAARRLKQAGVAWIEVKEPRPGGTRGEPDVAPVHPVIRAAFDGPLVLNSDYDGASGQAVLDADEADAIAFGRTFLANPDLPRRIAEGLPFNEPDEATFYTQGERGYTDYPRYQPIAEPA